MADHAGNHLSCDFPRLIFMLGREVRGLEASLQENKAESHEAGQRLGGRDRNSNGSVHAGGLHPCYPLVPPKPGETPKALRQAHWLQCFLVRTYFARSNWKKVFSTICSKHSYANIGVFYCGAPVLAQELSRFVLCAQPEAPAD